MLIVDTAKEADIDPAEVAAVFNLTRMEGRVAVKLAQGMSVDQIAVSMGRKESTIRSHVKSMLAKHGYTRQAELARLVQSLAGAPRERSRGVKTLRGTTPKDTVVIAASAMRRT